MLLVTYLQHLVIIYIFLTCDTRDIYLFNYAHFIFEFFLFSIIGSIVHYIINLLSSEVLFSIGQYQ